MGTDFRFFWGKSGVGERRDFFSSSFFLAGIIKKFLSAHNDPKSAWLSCKRTWGEGYLPLRSTIPKKQGAQNDLKKIKKTFVKSPSFAGFSLMEEGKKGYFPQLILLQTAGHFPDFRVVFVVPHPPPVFPNSCQEKSFVWRRKCEKDEEKKRGAIVVNGAGEEGKRKKKESQHLSIPRKWSF